MAKKKRKHSKKPKHVKKAKRISKRKLTKTTAKNKEIPIKLAGALYVIVGIVSFLTGLVMLYFSYFAGGLITVGSSILMQGNLVAFSLGIGSMTFGIVEFMIGFGLWKFYKWAGFLGLIVSGISAVLSIFYIALNPFAGTLSFVYHFILVLLIYTGRENLYGHVFE